jgi:hypothetical protein
MVEDVRKQALDRLVRNARGMRANAVRHDALRGTSVCSRGCRVIRRPGARNQTRSPKQTRARYRLHDHAIRLRYAPASGPASGGSPP